MIIQDKTGKILKVIILSKIKPRGRENSSSNQITNKIWEINLLAPENSDIEYDSEWEENVDILDDVHFVR